MRSFKLLSALALVSSVLAFTSCIKDNDFFSTDTSESNRKTIIKISGGGGDPVQRARDVSPTIDTFMLIEVRRDAANQGELNQPLTVQLVKDAGIITAYNQAHGTNFVELPSSAYTLLDDINALTFQPGEFAKEVRIRLNKSQLDLSKQYALAFKVGNAGTAVASATGGEVIYAVGVKNRFDGIYKSTGYFEHPTAPRAIDKEKPVATSGPNSVTLEFGDLGGSGWQMEITVNTDNSVTLTPKGATNTTARLDPTYNNRYDPATRTFYLKYYYPVPDPTRIITETLTYVRSR